MDKRKDVISWPEAERALKKVIDPATIPEEAFHVAKELRLTAKRRAASLSRDSFEGGRRKSPCPNSAKRGHREETCAQCIKRNRNNAEALFSHYKDQVPEAMLAWAAVHEIHMSIPEAAMVLKIPSECIERATSKDWNAASAKVQRAVRDYLANRWVWGKYRIVSVTDNATLRVGRMNQWHSRLEKPKGLYVISEQEYEFARAWLQGRTMAELAQQFGKRSRPYTLLDKLAAKLGVPVGNDKMLRDKLALLGLT